MFAPNNNYLMELNRNGKWREVDKIGQDILKKRRTFTDNEICETYFHVIYAKTRLSKKEDAIKLMNEFDNYSMNIVVEPELFWIYREISVLKNELGLLSEVQTILFSAMEKNKNADYIGAIELCNLALKESTISNAEKANANFILTICYSKLSDLQNAEAYYSEYLLYKRYLAKNHPALSQEKYVIEGLAALRENK
jgi:hypothetical protein